MIAKILSPGAATAAARATEELAEDVTEDIFKTRSEVESAAKRTAITERRMTELIILCTFLGIGKNLVSLGYFLEFLLCLSVARIAIRVVLERKLSVSLLYLVLANVAINT